MKRKITFYTLSLASIVILFICGCKKDDSSTIASSKPNTIISKDTLYYVQYDGKKYQIDNAHIFYSTLFSGINGCYFYYMYLVSKEVTYNSYLNHMTGTGDGLMLNITSCSNLNYTGSYAIDTSNNIIEPGDLLGGFHLNSEFSTIKASGTDDEFFRGNCTISQISSDTVLVTGNFTTLNNKIVKINYRGILPRHESNY